MDSLLDLMMDILLDCLRQIMLVARKVFLKAYDLEYKQAYLLDKMLD